MQGSLSFDRFQLLPATRQLLVDGAPADLGARALDVLCVLVERAGQLVTKNELLDKVWPDVFVEEANLHVQVSALRKVLGRDAIATVPGRGYQFVLPVQARDQVPAHAVQATQPGQPPSALPALLGRDAELRHLRMLVEREALVTVTGAGGSGKTLLARHLMQSLQGWRRHGATWVELLDVSGPATVPAVVAAALGFASAGGSAESVARALHGSDRLLVLDNAEHVLAAVAELVLAVRERAPEVRLVITSQAPLKLAGEQRLALTGLAVPVRPCTAELARSSPAVALFVERARQVDRRFRLDDASVDDVVAICAALDGSALGVQLAAALLAMHPLADVRRRLVHEWSAKAPDVPGETVLRAALAWSHGLLGDAARRVFRRLAVALGPLPLPLVAAVASDEELDATAVADALADLVDRSLIDVEPGGSDAEPRYRLLEAPRAVALEELLASGEASDVRARLARDVAALARRTSDARMRAGSSASAHLAREGWPSAADVQASLFWALEHDVHEAAVIARMPPARHLPAAERMACALRLRQWGEQADLPPAMAGDALIAAAALMQHSDLRQRFDLFCAAAERYAAAERTVDRCHALLRAVDTASARRRPEDAEAALQQVRALEDASWPPLLHEVLAVAEAAVLNARDDVHAAVRAWRRAAELERAGGAPALATLVSLADAELKVGLAEAAAEHLHEAAELAERLGNLTDRWSMILANLAAARLMQGDLAGAREAAAEAWPHALRLDADPWWADHLSLLAVREGRPRIAALLLGLADASYARINDGRHPLEERHAHAAAAEARSALGDATFEALRRDGRTAAHEDRIRREALSRSDVTWA